jgi:hypothetical protein
MEQINSPRGDHLSSDAAQQFIDLQIRKSKHPRSRHGLMTLIEIT